MSRYISMGRREDVVRNKKKGKSDEDIAEFLNISVSSVKNIWDFYVRTGRIDEQAHNCGRKSLISEDEKAKIFDELRDSPDITLLQLINKLNLNITKSGLSKWLKRRGYMFSAPKE